MNILYVGKRSNDSTSGIEKKMMGQIKALEKLGNHLFYTYFEDGIVYLSDLENNKYKLVKYKDSTVSMYLSNEKALKKALELNLGINLIYMRKGMCSPLHLSNLKKYKKHFVKVIEEIPTYPYDAELKSAKGVGTKIFYIVDRLFRGQLQKYVDYFTCYGNETKIFNVSSIPIKNGIDVESIPLRNAAPIKDEVRILTVSAMYFWHGYDRLIKGLSEYYSQNDIKIPVHLDMVGEGDCTEEWKKLSEELNISEYVHFWGAKNSSELDELFNNTNIAVSSLGIHRLGIYTSSTLKNREYVSRGIPIVMSSKDDGLDAIQEFCLKVPDDESNIDINNIIDFAFSIKDYSQAALTMRNHASANFAWEFQMKKVLDCLNNKKSEK